MRMFDVNFSYFRTNKQLSMSWPTGSRTRRALGKIKGRAKRPLQGKGSSRSLEGGHCVSAEAGAAAAAAGPGGPEVLGPFPRRRPGAQRTGLEMLRRTHGAVTPVSVPARVSGAASVLVSEHQVSCWVPRPLTTSEPKGATPSPASEDVFRVRVRAGPWVSGHLRTCPNRPPRPHAYRGNITEMECYLCSCEPWGGGTDPSPLYARAARGWAE